MQVTNDIFTQEDGEFLVKHSALSPDRIRPIETGGCPHAAIREDISANLQACEELTAMHNADLVLVESGGGTPHSYRQQTSLHTHTHLHTRSQRHRHTSSQLTP